MSIRTTQPAATSTNRILPWWLIGVIAVMFAFALFGNRGILHLFQLKRQQAGLEQQLAQIEEINNGLRKEITSLSADRRHLERMARSQLGMVREDEMVYQFAGKPHATAPLPPAGTAGPPH
jgi:cell division protein FtsB/cell division protein DivIC